MPIIKHNGNTYCGLGTNIEVDTSVIEGSTNAVSGGAVYEAIQNIQTSLKDIEITLSVDAWTLDETDNTYKQMIAIEGLSANSNPIIVLNPENEEATDDELNAFACLLDETIIAEDTITFVASQVPTISFSVIAKNVISSGEDKVIELETRVSELETCTTNIEEQINEINSDLENINDSLTNRGWLLVPYVTLESGISTQTDSDNNWSEFKGFVLGIECTGGDGTSYCETKYIPRNYATITDSFKHVMSLNYSDNYSFIGFARLYVPTNTVTFVTTAFTGWKEPKWFLYGIK